MNEGKILVAYYSFSGNTKSVAEIIKEKTNGDVFEIETFKDYPANYNDLVKLAKQEQENNINPELKKRVENISEYDVIYLGTPVWWYTMSNPIKTFILENDLSGKIIKPFCTHGGGGSSATFEDMKKLAPKAIFLNGLSIFERGSGSINADIEKWIEQ